MKVISNTESNKIYPTIFKREKESNEVSSSLSKLDINKINSSREFRQNIQ